MFLFLVLYIFLILFLVYLLIPAGQTSGLRSLMCLPLYPLSCPSIATALFLKPPLQLVRLWFSLPTFFSILWPDFDTFQISDFVVVIVIVINSNWTQWSTIQGVIARVIKKSDEREVVRRFEITSTITP